MAVKIPIYQAQRTPETLLQIASNPNANPVAVSDAVGRGMANLSSGLSDVANAFQAKADMDSITAAGKTASQASVEWAQYFNKKSNEAPEGAPNFTGDLLSEFDKYRDETLNNESNPRARVYLSRQLESLRNTLSGQAIHFEARAGVAARDTNVENAFQNWGKMVASGQMSYTEAQNNVDTLIANAGYDPILRADRAMKYRERLADAYWDGKIQRDANGAQAALKSSFAPENMPADTNEAITQSANRLGIAPADLRAIISYETGGTFDPNIKGGKGNKHIGLIQFGPEEQKKYGVKPGQTVAEQMQAVERYLIDRGAQKGDDLLTLYKIVNGGNRNVSENASDGNGTIAQHVEKIRREHGGGAMSPDDAAALRSTPVGKLPSYMSAADTRVRQNQAVYRQDIERRLNDADAMARNGIVDPNPLIQQHFVSAYGAEEGARQYEVYAGTQQMAGDIAKMRTMPNEEIGAFLAQNAPQPGAGYDIAAKRFGVMQQSAAAVLKMRDDDPATFVLKSSPQVSQAYTSLQSSFNGGSLQQQQASARAYADASIAEQKRLGIGQPRLLSKAYSDAVQQQFIGSVGGEDVAQKIQGLSNLWGNYWPTVYKQLIADKALPPTAIVIGSGMTGAAAADMAMASKYKEDDILAGFPDGKAVKKDVGERLVKQMEEFRLTMVGSDGNPRTVGGLDTYNLFYAQTEKLALYYVSQGMSEKDAVKKAADATVLGRYEVISQYGPYRVPKTENVSKVTDGAHYAIVNLKAEDIAMPATMRQDGFVRTDVLKNVKRKGYWVTSPNEDGLVLFNADTRAPVLRGDGQPIAYTWGQLASMNEDGIIPTGVR